jgi:alginate O-acetyltransferase complex protein AlgI
VVLYLLTWFGQARAAVWWVGLASFAFYALGEVRFVALLIASVIVNYLIGRRILAAAMPALPDRARARRKRWVAAGIAANLLTLGYFKYMNFFLDNIASASGWQSGMVRVVLPIGISFFTFTQIAFLVDAAAARGTATGSGTICCSSPGRSSTTNRSCHRSKAPVLAAPAAVRSTPHDCFSASAFKKVLIADSLSPHMQQIFHDIPSLGFVEAWAAALLYTFQLYYDFSGYSEMAVGLGLLINVEIPINFNSPYKSTSIIEFWRRWHISLLSFLRDFLDKEVGGPAQEIGAMEILNCIEDCAAPHELREPSKK